MCDVQSDPTAVLSASRRQFFKLRYTRVHMTSKEKTGAESKGDGYVMLLAAGGGVFVPKKSKKTKQRPALISFFSMCSKHAECTHSFTFTSV